MPEDQNSPVEWNGENPAIRAENFMLSPEQARELRHLKEQIESRRGMEEALVDG